MFDHDVCELVDRVATEAVGRSDKRNQDECIWGLPAQTPNGVANLRRCGIFDIAEAHERYILDVQAENAGYRQCIGLLGPRADTLSFDELRDHQGDGFVEQTDARNAKHWLFGPPSFRQLPH